ncbi:PA0069 family radical SAM protein [Methylocaldum sp.]|uniref:PA0069 family radical SAM protein n=1 Tax=Methylocaldum sp. TaxID=1969727 RepID=UPI002D5FC0AC|nr:PA0069 family radical SAM protein [Methylocaldum sp.]HYE34898.1 PA0069 family radical SAM protein [Methylocaldum sp.]
MSEDKFDKIPAPNAPIKGRGAASNRESRYSETVREKIDDGWWPEDTPPLKTIVTHETSRSIITRNRSPDIPFDQSINAYRGCEHGCIYCYARPSHAYLGLSPGLDFESRLFVKPDAADLLRKELAKKTHRPSPIALGANTDPYQPLEKEWHITRQILEVLYECRHPVSITTKSALIERDLDLLSAMARERLAQVQISITTLDKGLARIMEPRATSPQRRLQSIRLLVDAGVPVTVLVAPVIPILTDAELETILAQAAAHGAVRAEYIMLRLPLELNGLFREWLETHTPLKAKHVLARQRDIHGGKPYESSFGLRQSGSGIYADLIQKRFLLALKKTGLNATEIHLNSDLFQPPSDAPVQTSLF